MIAYKVAQRMDEKRRQWAQMVTDGQAVYLYPPNGWTTIEDSLDKTLHNLSSLPNPCWPFTGSQLRNMAKHLLDDLLKPPETE